MRQVAFTLCSNNYLAQAKTLGDSLVTHNPDYHFVIGLVDKFSPEIDYKFFSPHEIIEIETIQISSFQSLVEKFDIIELNTCVKPFMFLFLLEKYNTCDTIMYFDPDVLVLKRLGYIEERLTSNNIIITPHTWSPIGVDSLSHGENIFLKYGLYNLGFIGVSKTEETFRFLNWWKDRTYHLGFNDAEAGTFVDQKWINLVPLFFKGVCISEHLGLNVAFWNLHERHLSQRGDTFSVNTMFDLVFYHFSQFNPNNNVLASNHNRYTFDNRKDTVALFDIYRSMLLQNKYNYFKPFVCHFIKLKKELFREQVERQRKNLRFSVLFRLLKNWIPTSKARTLRTYMDYLINIKSMPNESTRHR